MTLQVAFVAADGFVIASDEKSNACEDKLLECVVPNLIRRANKVHKIVVAEKSPLVCAFSGNDVSAFVAQKLVKSSPDKFTDNAQVTAHLDRAMEFAREFMGEESDGSGHVVIAAIPNAVRPVNRLWRVFWIRETLTLAIKDKLYAGDTNNSAIFFGERYHHVSLPVRALTALAAHIVLEGHRQNGLRVDGLEIFISEDGKDARFLDDTELSVLREQSDDISRKLSSLLLRRD